MLFSILPYMNESLTLSVMGKFKRSVILTGSDRLSSSQILILTVKLVWKAKKIKTKFHPTCESNIYVKLSYVSRKRAK